MTTRLEAAPESAREARRVVNAVLDDWHCEHLAEMVVLLTSELVTNAVLHARSTVDLTLERVGDAVRVEVADRGPGDPVRRSVDVDATSGRGLALVDTLSRSWGVTSRGAEKVVWFEVGS